MSSLYLDLYGNWRQPTKGRALTVFACMDLARNTQFGPYEEQRFPRGNCWMPQVKRVAQKAAANLLGSKVNGKIFFTVRTYIKKNAELLVWIDNERKITVKHSITPGYIDRLADRLRILELNYQEQSFGFDIQQNKELNTLPDFGQLAQKANVNTDADTLTFEPQLNYHEQSFGFDIQQNKELNTLPDFRQLAQKANVNTDADTLTFEPQLNYHEQSFGFDVKPNKELNNLPHFGQLAQKANVNTDADTLTFELQSNYHEQSFGFDVKPNKELNNLPHFGQLAQEANINSDADMLIHELIKTETPDDFDSFHSEPCQYTSNGTNDSSILQDSAISVNSVNANSNRVEISSYSDLEPCNASCSSSSSKPDCEWAVHADERLKENTSVQSSSTETASECSTVQQLTFDTVTPPLPDGAVLKRKPGRPRGKRRSTPKKKPPSSPKGKRGRPRLTQPSCPTRKQPSRQKPGDATRKLNTSTGNSKTDAVVGCCNLESSEGDRPNLEKLNDGSAMAYSRTVLKDVIMNNSARSKLKVLLRKEVTASWVIVQDRLNNLSGNRTNFEVGKAEVLTKSISLDPSKKYCNTVGLTKLSAENSNNSACILREYLEIRRNEDNENTGDRELANSDDNVTIEAKRVLDDLLEVVCVAEHKLNEMSMSQVMPSLQPMPMLEERIVSQEMPILEKITILQEMPILEKITILQEVDESENEDKDVTLDDMTVTQEVHESKDEAKDTTIDDITVTQDVHESKDEVKDQSSESGAEIFKNVKKRRSITGTEVQEKKIRLRKTNAEDQQERLKRRSSLQSENFKAKSDDTTGEFVCDLCEMSFAIKAYLLCHNLVFHEGSMSGKRKHDSSKDEEDRIVKKPKHNFKCEKCNRKYEYEESLQFHQC